MLRKLISTTTTRPAPTPQSVWSTLTREERIEIRQLLETSAAHALRFHKGDGADPALADYANWAEDAAHSLWRGHGFNDIPTYRLASLIG